MYIYIYNVLLCEIQHNLWTCQNTACYNYHTTRIMTHMLHCLPIGLPLYNDPSCKIHLSCMHLSTNHTAEDISCQSGTQIVSSPNPLCSMHMEGLRARLVPKDTICTRSPACILETAILDNLGQLDAVYPVCWTSHMMSHKSPCRVLDLTFKVSLFLWQGQH